MAKSNALDHSALLKDFPFRKKAYDGKGIYYFDNGATNQKPQVVIDEERNVYEAHNANVHRGVYALGQQATAMYEGARKKIANFIGVESESELIFTRGTTESINLVAHAWGRDHVKIGDTVLVTRMDHHSNFVPWQYLAREKGAKFRIAELLPDGRLDLEALEKILVNEKPKVFAFPWVSNVLGVVNPIAQISKLCHDNGVTVVVDAAQAVGHLSVDLKNFPFVDFFAFSAHKMYGPAGIGALWGKKELLEKMKPYQLGGEMISEVRDLLSSWNELPWKFEAGTPNYPAAIAWGKAADYLTEKQMPVLEDYLKSLTDHFLVRLASIEGVALMGPFSSEERVPNFSMIFDDVHANDLATYLDQEKICVRVGHHCAEPLHRMMGEAVSCRASFGIYNTAQEIDFFFDKLEEALKFFSGRKKKKKKKEEKSKHLDSEALIEWLRDVQDPELNMSLVDLGLIYKVEVKKQDDNQMKAFIEMTLTSPGCPVAGSIVQQISDRAKSHPQVSEAEVKLVWDPKWNPKEMANEDAKEVLGIW